MATSEHTDPVETVDPDGEPFPAMPSVTHRIDTGFGYVYVTVAFDGEDQPSRVFINHGDSGGFTNSWCEALYKTISEALQSGSDVEDIANELVDIRADRVQTDNGDRIHSIPDAVGVALLRSVNGSGSVKGDSE
jgi:ribonucleoside-diphosphate reductase alpha chain